MATVIDNISALLGDDLKRTLPKSRLKIAASCFSIYAWEALKDELAKVESMEFIFTAPTFTPAAEDGLGRKEHREFFIPKAGRERRLYGSEFEIRLRNKLTQKAIARECAEWISRKAKFRSNRTNAPMPGFACVAGPNGDAVYSPLSGFTAADLGYQKSDAVFNFCNRLDAPAETRRYLDIFNQIWNSPEHLADVTEAVAAHMTTVYQENPPARIYFLMLYHIFEKFLEEIDEDVLPNDRTGFRDTLIWRKLFNFQADAAVGVINKLETYNGCILADSVGLGKTFTALAVIKYYELRNKSVLVLCPKKLTDNWLTYNRNLKTNIFSEDRFNYDVFCHTDLSRDSGKSFGVSLNQINWSNYDLVVIDESHNFRNNEAVREHETRYQRLMNKVIRGGVRTKVLMLTATPVNNRFVDLKNQLALAYEGEQSQLSTKLKSGRSIDDIFRQAQAAFNQWSKLEPEKRTPQAIMSALDFDFFELLDSVTIARSRKHIQTFYDTSEIGGFPVRRPPVSHRPPLTDLTEVMGFNDIYERLYRLTLAVYTPVSYVHPSRLADYEDQYDTKVDGGRRSLKQIDREKSLKALMAVNLLKRLESSVESFRLTLRRLSQLILDCHKQIADYNLNRLSIARYVRQRGLDEEMIDELEFDGDDFSTTGGKVKIDLADMDLKSWARDLENDQNLLNEIRDSLELVSPRHDAKLRHLAQAIAAKVASPINPGNRKVLIFTAFSDTAEYLYNQLTPTLLELGLNVGLVTGSSSPRSTLGRSYDFQSLLTLFSPRSKEKDKIMPDDPGELDVLIGTDCISEGQNLQDCDFVVNYDIHWNPVRIIQRFGRIDRIGSVNQCIQLVNYWPDISLDEYINLKARVESRMVIADLTATGDDNPLGKSGDLAYRREQLRRLQDEVIELEDLKTGVSITDLGLNDFRMDLLNQVKGDQSLASTPLGLQTVVPADPAIGLKPGCIFALRRIGAAAEGHLLHPYYLVYVDDEGRVLADYTEVKKILDLLRHSCRERQEPLPEAFSIFNDRTNDGADMSAYTKLLNDAIGSIIEVREERDIESLFSAGQTLALEDSFSGLDDFELITFLAVV